MVNTCLPTNAHINSKKRLAQSLQANHTPITEPLSPPRFILRQLTVSHCLAEYIADSELHSYVIINQYLRELDFSGVGADRRTVCLLVLLRSVTFWHLLTSQESLHAVQ